MEIKVNFYIFAFLLLFFVTGQIQMYGIFMFFILLHEMGHLLVGILLGFKPKMLQIMPLGFAVSFQVSCQDYNKKILKSNLLSVKKIAIAFAGPLCNIIMAVILALGNADILGVPREYLIYSNIVIALFNLLPIYPLDGGRILKQILRLVIGMKKSMIRSNQISNAFVVLLTAIASIAILSYQNIAIVLIIVYLWGMMIVQNKRYHMKMKIYELMEKY